MHGRNREKKGNLNVVDAPCQGANKVILKWQRPLLEGNQEVAKRSGRNERM
jgi:hypothetical protein